MSDDDPVEVNGDEEEEIAAADPEAAQDDDAGTPDESEDSEGPDEESPFIDVNDLPIHIPGMTNDELLSELRTLFSDRKRTNEADWTIGKILLTLNAEEKKGGRGFSFKAIGRSIDKTHGYLRNLASKYRKEGGKADLEKAPKKQARADAVEPEEPNDFMSSFGDEKAQADAFRRVEKDVIREFGDHFKREWQFIFRSGLENLKRFPAIVVGVRYDHKAFMQIVEDSVNMQTDRMPALEEALDTVTRRYQQKSLEVEELFGLVNHLISENRQLKYRLAQIVNVRSREQAEIRGAVSMMSELGLADVIFADEFVSKYGKSPIVKGVEA
jgi:hypothetical protein